jgi:hypothetical protein
MPKTPYPNSWYVEQFFDYGNEGCEWKPLLGSVGNKSYATGYANALDSIYPHPPYRLIDKKGKVAKEFHARVSPRF